MDIIFDETTQNPKQIGLRGRLDLKGTGEIELRFTSLTATDANDVVIDMSGVDFIASLGMRLLLTCAKAKSARGGRMIMFGCSRWSAKHWKRLESTVSSRSLAMRKAPSPACKAERFNLG